MRATERREQILTILSERGTASVAELAVEFDVSQNTVRNDLDDLADQQLIARTHGGATIARFVLPPQLRPKSHSLTPGAEYIIDYAVSWIKGGDFLILGDSALCVRLAERITSLSHLRVITTSLPIAYLLAQEPSNTIVIAGGEFEPATLSTRGSMAQTAIKDFRADKAFFSCTGVSPQSGFTEISTESAQIKQGMKDAADSVFVLIESSRIGKTDLFPVGDLEESRRIVTDDGLELAQARALVERCAKIAVCGPGGHRTYRPRPSREKGLRIGFANLCGGIWFAQDVRAGLEQAAQQAEQVELLVVDNQNSVEVAVRNATELLKQDIDLLIEYDGTGVAGRSILRMMQLADVPVVAVDIPFMGATYFGCNHDAVGISAGQALGHWIREEWDGTLDEVMLVTCAGGGDKRGNGAIRTEDWRGGALPSSLAPAMRLDAALDTVQTLIHPTFHVRRLVAPGDWGASFEAIPIFRDLFIQTLRSIPQGRRVAVICLLNELALGLAQAVRETQREDHIVVVSFGGQDAATRVELSAPDTCLLGIVDLRPERYGEALLEACLSILRGDAVPPAVFVEHEFLSRMEIRVEVPMK